MKPIKYGNECDMRENETEYTVNNLTLTTN